MKIGALFDIDGVLVDSISLNWAAINAVLAEYDIKIETEQISRYLGKTLVDSVELISADLGVEIDFAQFKHK